DPDDTLGRFTRSIRETLPPLPAESSRSKEKLDVVAWFRGADRPPGRVRVMPGTIEHDRHARKYAQGDLEEDAFFFRGPGNRMNLRARNLIIFSEMAQGVDEETWLFHLKKNDYSGWIRKATGDDQLAAEIEGIERTADTSRSRQQVVD